MESTPHAKFNPDVSPPLTMQHSSSCGDGSGVVGYIEHTVSKYDTLAGVAIKYGVEVADIKRMNGLTTDLQMFALKSLQIPLPGRHPPSPVMSNGHDTRRPSSSEITPPSRRYRDPFPSIKLSSSSRNNISPSMKALRGYYGLSPNVQNGHETTQIPKTPLGLHRKSKSEFLDKPLVTDKSAEKLVRRRKSEVDLKNHSPEDTSVKPNLISLGGSRDSLMAEAFNGVRKSSSTPSFQNSDSNSTVWLLNLTAELQALSTAAITRPIFDGLPKPISGRKNKAALD